MSGRVLYLHVGLPKTGTTYLQHLLAGQRDRLLNQGLLYPGSDPDHFLATLDVMDRKFHGHSDDRVTGMWSQTVEEVNRWEGNSLISHEVLALADEQRIRRIIDAFGSHEIRVVVTARDLARQLPAVWQEEMKNGRSYTLAEYVEKARSDWDLQETERGFWSRQDLPAIVQRWRSAVGTGGIDLVSVPPRGADRGLLLRRYGTALDVDLAVTESPGPQNESLGLSQAEFLRRLNEQVWEDLPWPEYRTFVKHLLVRRAFRRNDELEPIRLSVTDQEWAAATSQELIARLPAEGLAIHGDLDDLVSSPDGGADQVADEKVVFEMGLRSSATLLRHIARAEIVDTSELQSLFAEDHS